MIEEMASASHDIEMRYRILHAVDRALDEISVKQICENAGISRWTFYHYFNSKYDIPYWHGVFVQRFYADEIGRTLDWETGYYHDFRLLEEERDFYHHAMRYPVGNSETVNLMEAHRKATIMETLLKYRGAMVDDDLEFCIDAFVHTETALVAKWLSSGFEPDLATFTRRMVETVPRRLYELMEIDMSAGAGGMREHLKGEEC